MDRDSKRVQWQSEFDRWNAGDRLKHRKPLWRILFGPRLHYRNLFVVRLGDWWVMVYRIHKIFGVYGTHGIGTEEHSYWAECTMLWRNFAIGLTRKNKE